MAKKKVYKMISALYGGQELIYYGMMKKKKRLYSICVFVYHVLILQFCWNVLVMANLHLEQIVSCPHETNNKKSLIITLFFLILNFQIDLIFWGFAPQLDPPLSDVPVWWEPGAQVWNVQKSSDLMLFSTHKNSISVLFCV